MWQVTLRGIRAHLGRFLLTALSVTLGVAFLSGTLSFRDTFSDTFSNLVDSTMTNDIYVTGPETAESMAAGMSNDPVPADLVDEISTVDGVERVVPTYAGLAMIYDSQGQPVNMANAPSLGFSYDGGRSAEQIISGTEPSGQDEILVEKSTATRAKIEAGDTVTIIVGTEPMDVRVSGIIELDSSMAGASIVFLPSQWAESLWGDTGTASEIAVDIASDSDADTVKERITEAIGETYVVRTAEEYSEDAREVVDQVVNMLGMVLLMFVVVALGIGTFIIANTFQISVRQRQREFALLRAIGASPRQVFLVVLIQAIVVGLIGSIVGVLAGQGLILGIRELISAAGMPLDSNLLMRASTALASIVIGTVVTVIGSVVPARRAALTPPVEAMRDVSGATQKPVGRRTIIGVSVLVVGAALVYLGGWRVVDWHGAALGVGALAAVTGTILVTPALVPAFARVLTWPARAFFAPIGQLASGSMTSQTRKTATTTSALVIGVALVAAGATVADTTKASLTDIIRTNVTSEIMVILNVPTDDVSHGLAVIEGADHITDADASFATGQADVTAGGEPFRGQVGSPHPDLVGSDLGMRLIDGDDRALENGSWVVSQMTADDHGIEVGDTVTVDGVKGAVTGEVGAIVESFLFPFDVFMPEEDGAELTLMNPSVNAIVVTTDGDVAAAKQSIIDAVDGLYVFTVYDKDDLADMVVGQIDQLVTMLYAMLALSIVIAILGIINTLSLSISDRTREIGLLRAVGLSRRSVTSMIMTESLVMTLMGAILGVALGVPLGLALATYLADDMTIIFTIPWATLGFMAIISIIVGIIAALLPARKAAKLKILDAIAED